MRALPALVLASLFASLTTHAAQTVYRYRAFTGTAAPNTVSNYFATDSQLPAVTTVPRGPTGGPFQPFRFATFNGNHRYVTLAFPQAGALSGNFTVTAHLRIPAVESGEQVILSTRGGDGAAGIRLALVDGKVAGTIRITDGAASTLERTLTTPEPLIPGRWYRVAYRYQRTANGSTHVHDLWVDTTRVVNESLPSTFTRADGGLSPVIGAERDGSGYAGHLRASVFAVQVDDYALREYFLGTPLVRDNSDYFGMISHHDYLGLTSQGGKIGGNPMEKRLVDSYYHSSGIALYQLLEQRRNGLWFMPFMNDNYVPQGLAADPENQRVFLAYYHRTQANVANSEQNLIAEVFLPEGRLGNVFLLRTETDAPLLNSHMGGIAYWNGFIIAPSIGSGSNAPSLYVFDISETPPSSFDPATLTGFNPVQLRASQRIVNPQSMVPSDVRFATPSFLGVHFGADHQPYLHVGHFDEASPRPTHIFKIGTSGGSSSRTVALSDPITLWQSHRRAQGMNFYFDAMVGAQRIRRAFLSNSWGNGDSRIYTSYYMDISSPIAGAEFLLLPAGIQDLARMGNSLLSVSESGAIYYQKRDASPWSKLYPFLVSVDISDLIDTNGNGIPDQWYHHHNIPLSTSPDSDLDGDGFSIRQEFLWDTNPNDPGDHPWNSIHADPLEIRLPGSPARFYTLKRSTNMLTWEPVPGLTHRRGTPGVHAFPIEGDLPHAFYRVVVDTD